MKNIKLNKMCILFFMLTFLLLEASEVFEQSLFQNKPTEIGRGFATVEESDFVPKLSKYQSPEVFSSDKQEVRSLQDSFKGFEDVAVKQEKNVDVVLPIGFEQGEQETEIRTLTDHQKSADQIFQQRLEQDKSKLENWWKLQEVDFFNQRKALWKSYEKKADKLFVPEKKSYQVLQQKSLQEQRLLQKLRDANQKISEQEKIVRDLSDSLEALKNQRLVALQRIMVQQSTVKSFDRQQKAGKSTAPKDVQNRIDYLATIDGQSHEIEKQLQQAQKIIQDTRQQAEEAQKSLDDQGKSTSATEGQY